MDAIQIHGAYGYSNEYPVERYLRNSKGSVIYEGTSQIHTLMQADTCSATARTSRCGCPSFQKARCDRRQAGDLRLSRSARPPTVSASPSARMPTAAISRKASPPKVVANTT